MIFADTGKERAETYEFIQRCVRSWSVRNDGGWLHYVEGEIPFDALILKKSYLSNPVTRLHDRVEDPSDTGLYAGKGIRSFGFRGYHT